MKKSLVVRFAVLLFFVALPMFAQESPFKMYQRFAHAPFGTDAGGTWYELALDIQNRTEFPLKFQVHFFSPEGIEESVPANTPFGERATPFFLEMPGCGEGSCLTRITFPRNVTFREGWLEIESVDFPGEPNSASLFMAELMFRYGHRDEIWGEDKISSEFPQNNFVVPAEWQNGGNIVTGLALANPTDKQIVARLFLRDETGVVEEQEITLAPRGYISEPIQVIFESLAEREELFGSIEVLANSRDAGVDPRLIGFAVRFIMLAGGKYNFSSHEIRTPPFKHRQMELVSSLSSSPSISSIERVYGNFPGGECGLVAVAFNNPRLSYSRLSVSANQSFSAENPPPYWRLLYFQFRDRKEFKDGYEWVFPRYMKYAQMAFLHLTDKTGFGKRSFHYDPRVAVVESEKNFSDYSSDRLERAGQIWSETRQKYPGMVVIFTPEFLNIGFWGGGPMISIDDRIVENMKIFQSSLEAALPGEKINLNRISDVFQWISVIIHELGHAFGSLPHEDNLGVTPFARVFVNVMSNTSRGVLFYLFPHIKWTTYNPGWEGFYPYPVFVPDQVRRMLEEENSGCSRSRVTPGCGLVRM